MMHRYICDKCGAYLDPSERCSCQAEHLSMYKRIAKNYRETEEENGIKRNDYNMAAVN